MNETHLKFLASPEWAKMLETDLLPWILEAGDLGEIGIWRRDADHWVDLVPWTRSAAVRSGGSPNDLAARAVGSRLSFIVNGVEVAAIDDNALSGGNVGVFIGGDFNEVALDHFVVQVAD